MICTGFVKTKIHAAGTIFITAYQYKKRNQWTVKIGDNLKDKHPILNRLLHSCMVHNNKLETDESIMIKFAVFKKWQ